MGDAICFRVSKESYQGGMMRTALYERVSTDTFRSSSGTEESPVKRLPIGGSFRELPWRSLPRLMNQGLAHPEGSANIQRGVRNGRQSEGRAIRQG